MFHVLLLILASQHSANDLEHQAWSARLLQIADIEEAAYSGLGDMELDYRCSHAQRYDSGTWTVNATIQCAVSISRQSARVQRKYDNAGTIKNQTTGQSRPFTGRFSGNTSISTPGSYLFVPEDASDGRIRDDAKDISKDLPRIAVRRAKNFWKETDLDPLRRFDPRDWFKVDDGFVWQKLRWLAATLDKDERARDPSTFQFSEDARSATIAIEFWNEGSPKWREEWVLSKEHQYLPIRYTKGKSGGDSIIDLSIQYRVIDHKFIPNRVTQKISSNVEWSFELIHAEANTPFTDDDFNLRGLGLRPGDELFDEITGVVRTFDGETRLTPEDLNFPSANLSPPRTWTVWKIAFVAVALLFALLAIVEAALRRSHRFPASVP